MLNEAPYRRDVAVSRQRAQFLKLLASYYGDESLVAPHTVAYGIISTVPVSVYGKRQVKALNDSADHLSECS